MAQRVKTTDGKITVRGQRHDAADQALIKLVHLALPWAAWAGLTVFANLLYLGLWLRARDALTWAGLAVLGFCLVIAAADWRLRCHRPSWEGRWLGPLTAAGAGVATCLYLGLGIGLTGALAYLLCGATGCIVWDIWLAHGDARDKAAQFNAMAAAAGTPGAQMVGVRTETRGEDPGPRRTRLRARDRPAGPSRTVTRAGLVLPADPAMTAEDVAGQVGEFEVIDQAPRGSWAVTGVSANGGYANVTISDPGTLTHAPLPWPGPYAPGADMSVPFRLGKLQTGEDFLYPRLPVHHRKTTGKTGSGKTESLCWNMLAEGITRQDYAMVASDGIKGEQFLGPVRAALHDLAVTAEQRLLQMRRVIRAREMRFAYLAANRITEWYPGCGLTFMDVYMEEAAETLRQLGTTRTDVREGMLMLDEWVATFTAGRSAGISCTAGFQRPTKEQAVSAVANSQMGFFCFGVGADEDEKFGLSKLQRERGCRPSLFNTPAHRGLYFADTETVPDEWKVVPVRGWYWGPGSARIAAYAADWPSRDRPWDDVTGEAMSWTPAVSPSAGFPAPRGVPAAGGSYDNAGPPLSPKRQEQARALEETRKMIRQWAKDGRVTFTVRDLNGLPGIAKGRTWFYTALPALCREDGPLIRESTEGGKEQWVILANDPELLQGLQDAREAGEQDDEQEGAA
jgi:hypothetical protein